MLTAEKGFSGVEQKEDNIACLCVHEQHQNNKLQRILAALTVPWTYLLTLEGLLVKTHV